MIDTMVAIKAVKDVDEALGVIGQFIQKLRSQPDIAARKLTEALDEITKTWQVIDMSIVRFLNLGFEKEALEKGSKDLLGMAGGQLRVEVDRGRGHCSKIRNIYDEYLDRWFSRVLNPKEYDVIKFEFMKLAFADMDIFYGMEEMAHQLQEEADEILEMVEAGENEEARKRVLSSRNKLSELQRNMSRTMSELHKIKSELISMAGFV
jgi:hypothetical protein